MASIFTVVNDEVDPTFRFMTLDWDGKIRMDPSSPYAMRRLIDLKDRFDIAFACDTDHDRHGIVTAEQRPVDAQSIPVGGDRLSVSAIAALARGRCRRQNRGEQRHDRSGGRAVAAQPVRGAGGLQMVRRGTGGRHAGIRRRGKRRRLLQPHRRPRLDHRQGWLGARACWRRRSPRAPAAIPVERYRALAQELGDVLRRSHRCAGERRQQKKSLPNSTGNRSASANSPANRSTRSSRRHRATTRRSAASRSPRAAAGSRRVRPEPRTSTRSTLKASTTMLICAG